MAEADIAAAREDAAQARVRSLRTEIRASIEGLTTGNDGLLDVSINRRDDIVVRLAALETEHARVTARHEAAERRYRSLKTEFSDQASFAPVATGRMIVWKTAVSDGTSVTRGQELARLVDCSRRFVEVSLPERLFGTIAVGDAATIRLRGDTESLTGVVEALRGAEAPFEHDALAVQPDQKRRNQLRALLRIVEAPRTLDAGTSCDVGRSAEVRFQRQIMRTEFVAWLKDVRVSDLFERFERFETSDISAALETIRTHEITQALRANATRGSQFLGDEVIRRIRALGLDRSDVETAAAELRERGIDAIRDALSDAPATLKVSLAAALDKWRTGGKELARLVTGPRAEDTAAAARDAIERVSATVRDRIALAAFALRDSGTRTR